MSSLESSPDASSINSEGQNIAVVPEFSSESDAHDLSWLTGAMWLVSLAFACGLTLADPDLWGHTLYGLRALQQGILCERTDPFSYTAQGAVWINHEWLSEDLYAWLWLRFGNLGLWMWRNVCALIVFLIALAELRRQKASLAAITTLLLLSAAGLSHFFVFIRPQLGTFSLFAVTVWLLRGWWSTQVESVSGVDSQENFWSRLSSQLWRDRRLWWLPVMIALWVNLHGGWLAGWGILGVCWALSAWRAIQEPAFRIRFWAFSVICLAATLATNINPYGPGMHTMLWHHLVTDQVVREWQPLWGARQSVVYYVPFVLLLLSLPGWKRLSSLDWALLAIVGLQAVQHIRHISLLGITLLCVLPGPLSAGLQGWFPELSRRWSVSTARGWRVTACLAVTVLLAGLQLRGTWKLWQSGIAPWEIAVETRSDVPGVPVPAVAFLKENGIRGNLLTDYGWGQFAIWHLYPDCPIAFDGRYRTIYNAQLEAEFVAFQKVGSERPATTPMLDRHPTEIVLWPATRPVNRYLEQREDWTVVYRDEQAVVYLKRQARFAELIRRLEVRDESQPAVAQNNEIPIWQTFPGAWNPGVRVERIPASVQPGSVEAARDVQNGQALGLAVSD